MPDVSPEDGTALGCVCWAGTEGRTDGSRCEEVLPDAWDVGQALSFTV